MPENNNYATKADLNILRDEIIEAMSARLSEAIHDSETRLLNAFYGFAEANQKRLSLLENSQSGITG